MKKKLLYITLAESLMQDILSGSLEAGSKVLSVRDMAMQSKVNPKTVQKAFEYLEAREIFESRHGEGRFVTSDAQKLQSIKALLIEEEIDNFISVIANIDIPKEEILKLLANKLEDK
ncbi:GntR family transcriptional regulator [Mollicutes bacterium LVI A0039]|nr:GntR family transcriptional regulator [Mollicutes bacterium LVI A0039]